MKTLYFFILIALVPVLSKAQDIYEIKFTSGYTQYRCALALWSDGSGKMRVRYYNNGSTRLVQQDMRLEKTSDGGMRIAGYNATYASTGYTASSYSPDNFYISQDEYGNMSCWNIDDTNHWAKASISSVKGYYTKQAFLGDFDWKLNY